MGYMKSLKINKEDALVHSKWRRLIRGTEGDSDDSEGLNVQSFTDTSSPGLSWKKAFKWFLFLLLFIAKLTD